MVLLVLPILKVDLNFELSAIQNDFIFPLAIEILEIFQDIFFSSKVCLDLPVITVIVPL